MEYIGGMGDVGHLQVHVLHANNKIDPISLLPDELILKIFSYLNASELSKSCRVSSAWCALARDDSLWKVMYLAAASFGKEDYEKKYGITIQDAPPIPKDHYEILKSRDPVCPEKKMVENWMFLLKVPMIDEKQPFDLEGMKALVTSKKIHEKGYQYIFQPIIAADKLKTVEKTHWILIRKIVDGTRSKNLEEQKKFVLDYSEQTKVAHEIPSTRDYVFFNFAAFTKYGKRPYGDNPWTYGRSLDTFEGCPTVVGGFSPVGLHVNRSSWNIEEIGVGLLRKF